MKRKRDIALYILLLVFYIIGSVVVAMTAQSQAVIEVAGYVIPFQSITGVFSSLTNICTILMVVFLGRKGYITSLVLIFLQLPVLAFGFLIQHRSSSISGMFSNLLAVVAIVLIYRRNKRIEEYQKNEVDDLKGQHKLTRRLFEQTATALVNAIDAKDTYSHGHSLRVAGYSEMIARQAGKSEEECRKIYYAALLHDVGKIGVSNAIINKKGKLTAEEFESVKQHSVMGNQILASIGEYPYLSLGAHYHHERYDGKGYPDHLKGEDIPEIARIISVADAYDAMTSNRSYRTALPQQIVREEIVKGSGSQFDPQFAKIMQHLIDMDPEYRMREMNAVSELSGKNELDCEKYRSEVSDGIHITEMKTRICLKVKESEGFSPFSRGPVMILFDSLDERVHDDEEAARDLNYFEYCEVGLDGKVKLKGARKSETDSSHTDHPAEGEDKKTGSYEIEAVRVRDHVLITIDDGRKKNAITIALPDSARFSYIALTGEHCRIYDVSIDKDIDPVPEDYIKRIAEEITYIRGNVGDVPNVQINGFRSDSTQGIPLKDKLELFFHTMSLPTARLIWHCAYLVIYASDDGKVNGPNYKEYSLIRLDGENWEAEGVATNKLIVTVNDSFEGWESWKLKNKKGFDVLVRFRREGNLVVTNTNNWGIAITCTTTIIEEADEVYVAITGDQCAITGIKIT
ncbi:MAG: HD-GYP domain-containing protein [Lachnospiraceae bacterium]|nr:HD-GYP domain-containing protein [Lachnospiraceae bacterium]